jgi:hypothetical protein
MALADSFPPKAAESFYQAQAIYNSGSAEMRRLRPGTKTYRDALLAAFDATFLRLEGKHPELILTLLRERHPKIPLKTLKTAENRALRIEPLFVELTNPMWQDKHIGAFLSRQKPHRQRGLSFEAPILHRAANLWMKSFGL